MPVGVQNMCGVWPVHRARVRPIRYWTLRCQPRKLPIGCLRINNPARLVPQRAGGRMSDQAVEILITNAIHSAFIKYPEGDGGPNLDYEWIAPDQSAHIAKAILLEL